MSVASHLGINLSEYDARIRTFIPDYEEMLAAGASAVPASARLIVDLGVGTGAFAARCLKRAARAQVVGVDADAEILAVAARRLGHRATFVNGSFLHADLPRSDVVVSSFALHHVRTRAAKLGLHRRIRKALCPGGRCIIVDSQPAPRGEIRRSQMDAWDAHLRRSYSRRDARRIFAAWAGEDVYVPLGAEVGLMKRAGFRVEILWRKGAFAVLVGT
jgi:ubiquinone/menaquinone biosynthesis C-methylase UbiE